jgi:hypothetical protein
VTPILPNRKYVVYVRTCALSRALDSVSEEAVARITASRSEGEGGTRQHPIDYVRYTQKGNRKLEVDFNKFVHGKYDKSAVLHVVKSTFGEALIGQLDLVLPVEFSAEAAKMADADADTRAAISGAQLVAHFEHTPCRREGEQNAFWADVHEYMLPEELEWMEAASLDLTHIVPFPVFRDVVLTHGRVGQDYKDKIDAWKETLGADPVLLEHAATALFSDKEIRGARWYQKGTQEKWILERVEHF